MATELGHLSLTQLQKLAHQSQQQQQQQHQQHQQHQPNPSLTAGGGSWMWNTSRRPVEDDDSWEVRAFAEDTGNIMGTTWPPRSYTCTFCRREFRSAQALGGHMNVHRRDRARLRLSPPVSADPSSTSTSSSNLIFPSQELIAANRGICFLYPLSGTPSNIFTSTSMNMCMESPSTLLSITPYPTNNLMNSSFPSPVTNFSAGMTSIHPSSLFHYSSSSNDKAVEQPSVSIDNEKLNDDIHNTNNSNRIEEVEELDLELRLGTGPSSS